MILSLLSQIVLLFSASFHAVFGIIISGEAQSLVIKPLTLRFHWVPGRFNGSTHLLRNARLRFQPNAAEPGCCLHRRIHRTAFLNPPFALLSLVV
jgi:hypothetical protein